MSAFPAKADYGRAEGASGGKQKMAKYLENWTQKGRFILCKLGEVGTMRRTAQVSIVASL
jgi:hypothetical protein